MGKTIEVKESFRDRFSLFNVKKFDFDGLIIERPKKVLDAKNVRYEHMRVLLDSGNLIFEKSLFVNWKSLHKIIESNDTNKIRSHFGFPCYTNGYPRYISITFTFNPFKQIEDRTMIEKHLESYLMYYQAYSTSALLVPNVKIYGTVMTSEGYKKKTITTLSDFINIVDTMYKILDYRNNKPIFVPLSLRFSMSDISKLALHYIENDYYNIWIDFEGGAVTEDKIARIRRFVLEYDKKGLFDRIVMIATNVRREIMSNIKKDFTPASDALTSLIGANIIGVNREPPKRVEGKVVVEKSMLLEHKARVFDANTYYYFKVTKAPWLKQKEKELIMQSKGTNIAFNAKLLDEELYRQTNALLNNNTVKKYLSDKKMLQEYKGGSLFKELFSEKYYASGELMRWF